MKIVQINSFSNGSTGKIMMSIHNELLNNNYDSYVVWGRGRKSENEKEIFLNNKFGVYYHIIYSRLTGKVGFASKLSTKKLIIKLKKIKPDIVHLHNIHGYYINIELLFNYLKQEKIKVIWTLHDCWAFTGQCPHFTLKHCKMWIKGCHNCPMIHDYPKTIKDNSKWNYFKKKELFTGLDITLVTPSKWLADLVKQSFLKEYPVKVINNGIDLNIFKQTESNFRKRHNLENKKMILGVANIWDTRKGLNDFIELSKIIDDNYIIVLVGLSQKQIDSLPNNIIGITRTENQQELASIYSTADVYFNSSLEETFGLTTVEALACNTKVLVYNSSALPEIINSNLGSVIEHGNIYKVYETIKELISRDNIRNDMDKFSNDTMIDNYINLYNQKYYDNKN